MNQFTDQQMAEINRWLRHAFFNGLLFGISIGIAVAAVIDIITK